MFLIVLAAVAAFLGWLWWRRRRLQQRVHYVLGYAFASGYGRAVQAQYPAVTAADLQLAETALRQFFLMHLLQPQAQLHMPSRLADALWHAFILDTRRYQQFCEKAFGQVFHHIPAHAMPPSASIAGAQRLRMQDTWNAAMATRRWLPAAVLSGIPLLFMLDARAQLADGQVFSAADLRYWVAQYAQLNAGQSDTGSSSSSGNASNDSISGSGHSNGGSACTSTSAGSSSDSGCGDSGSSSCGGGCGGGGGGGD